MDAASVHRLRTIARVLRQNAEALRVGWTKRSKSQFDRKDREHVKKSHALNCGKLLLEAFSLGGWDAHAIHVAWPKIETSPASVYGLLRYHYPIIVKTVGYDEFSGEQSGLKDAQATDLMADIIDPDLHPDGHRMIDADGQRLQNHIQQSAINYQRSSIYFAVYSVDDEGRPRDFDQRPDDLGPKVVFDPFDRIHLSRNGNRSQREILALIATDDGDAGREQGMEVWSNLAAECGSYLLTNQPLSPTATASPETTFALHLAKHLDRSTGFYLKSAWYVNAFTALLAGHESFLKELNADPLIKGRAKIQAWSESPEGSLAIERAAARQRELSDAIDSGCQQPMGPSFVGVSSGASGTINERKPITSKKKRRVDEAVEAERKVVDDRWKEYVVDARKTEQKISWPKFVAWADEKRIDLPSDDPNELKRLKDAYRKLRKSVGKVMHQNGRKTSGRK